MLPVEVWGPPRVQTDRGTVHLQPYVCSVVHNALSFVKSGGLDVAEVLVVPHACDSLQGLGSVLLDFACPQQPVLPLYIPRGSREIDIAFFADELRSAYQRLEEITGAVPSATDLHESIGREETADEWLGRLHRERANLPMSDETLYSLIRSREYLPAEAFSEIARETFDQWTVKQSKGVPILLSGIVPEPMSLFAAIEGMGGTVIGDDFACCGRRLYPPGTSDDPFVRMAERILTGPPDPMRGSPISERLQHLLAMVDASGAKGVIFYTVKFCEPELFDLPDLRRGLQDAGIPSLTIEIDISDRLSQRVQTRTKAFLEMIA
jgi:benzoyl-CoA reductase/2-hydroxyglutaryl-CoA dehydratase subunit BcrC/BadD/HgdB